MDIDIGYTKLVVMHLKSRMLLNYHTYEHIFASMASPGYRLFESHLCSIHGVFGVLVIVVVYLGFNLLWVLLFVLFALDRLIGIFHHGID